MRHLESDRKKKTYAACGVLSLSVGVPSAYITAASDPYLDVTGLVPVLGSPAAVARWAHELAQSGFPRLDRGAIFNNTGIPRDGLARFLEALGPVT